MKMIETGLPDCYILELDRRDDIRGSFMRGFDRQQFLDLGLPADIDHTAEAINHAAFTLRGLHFQAPNHPEPKLVRCLRGSIFDVVVDIRNDSPSFGRWQSVRLEADDTRVLFIPSGFAHGYLTLTSSSIVSYHLFAPFVAKAQRGIMWNDPGLNINWPATPRVIGERDRQFPFFSHIPETDFQFSNINSKLISDVEHFREVS